MVVKLFPLSLVSSLKHRKYAATEFVNTLKADDLGLSVPRVHAYLEKRQGLRVSCVGIVFEELQGYQELSRLLRRGIFSVEKCGTIAAETLAQLYAVGANHLDGRDANIMVHPETGQIRVIDWQFANFVAPRAEWLLEHLAGFHLQRSHEYRNYYLDSYWLQELHALSNHTSSIQLFRDRVVSLSKRKYSLGKRSKLTPLSG
ncbi:MAG: lipopolysaccharide kinase InaA family protein [Pseudomonadota bacterium]